MKAYGPLEITRNPQETSRLISSNPSYVVDSNTDIWLIQSQRNGIAQKRCNM